jgi:hypothetical protein
MYGHFISIDRKNIDTKIAIFEESNVEETSFSLKIMDTDDSTITPITNGSCLSHNTVHLVSHHAQPHVKLENLGK